jgi:hypothetical protein
LESLGCDGKLSDDIAMQYIAAMPRLSHLRAQESVATDDGFVALSRFKTIESIWGRECPKLPQPGIYCTLENAGAARLWYRLQEC